MFSNEGIGTLIYTNEYQAIRTALKKDVRAVYSLIQQGVQAEELVKRTRGDLEKMIGDFYVFEVDKNPVGCGAVHLYPTENIAELACVYVDPRYENQGIGGKQHNGSPLFCPFVFYLVLFVCFRRHKTDNCPPRPC